MNGEAGEANTSASPASICRARRATPWELSTTTCTDGDDVVWRRTANQASALWRLEWHWSYGMDWQAHISADSGVLAGKPVVKGTRISVELILDCLGRGWSIDDILGQYPHLSRQGVVAAVEYARDLVQSERVSALRT